MFCATLLALALALTADPKPRLDADGIPLPAEALRRFGSLRWYADPPRSVAFSPDGKVAYLVPADLDRFDPLDHTPAVTAWEMSSGRPLWQFTDPPLTGLQVAADPDGKTVWLAGRLGRGDQGEWHKQPFVRVKLNALTGQELARKELLPGWSQALDLKPDGTMAWNRFQTTSETEGDLSLRILKPDGTEGATWEPDGEQGIDVVKFSPDGKTLFVSGPKLVKFKSRLAAVDPTTGKTKWTVDCPQVDSVAVSPDGKTLAAVTASTKLPTPPGQRNGWPEEDATYLARFDAATGESKISVQIGKYRRNDFRQNRPYFGRPIRYTPDGKSLLVLSDDRKVLPIDPVEWAKGKEDDNPAAFAWPTPDGKSYLPGYNRSQPMRLYDATTREPLPNQPDPLVRATWASGYGVSFPDGGKRVRFGRRGDLVEWDAASGKEVARIPREERKGEPQTGVAQLSLGLADVSLMSPDGKVLFRQYGLTPRSGERKKPELLDAKSGEPAAVKLTWGESLDRIAFTPDSKKLIGMESGGSVYIWDLTTGGKPLLEKRLNKAGGGGVNSLMCMTDSFALVAEPNWGFNYYDPAQRWSVSRFPFEGFKREKTWRGQGTIEDLATTPNGGFAGWAKVWHGEGKEPTKALFVVDPGADDPREYPLEAGTGFAVSPDGRMAAFGVGSGGIELYELSTGKKRHTFTGLKRPALSLAFSADGKTMASESADGPVILWDVKGDLTKASKPDAAGWDAAWKALTGDDAEKAFAAVRLIAAYPDDGTPELAKRFAEVKSPTAVSAERAVEALRLADTESARKQVAEWAKGPDKHPLTIAAKRK